MFVELVCITGGTDSLFARGAGHLLGENSFWRGEGARHGEQGWEEGHTVLRWVLGREKAASKIR